MLDQIALLILAIMGNIYIAGVIICGLSILLGITNKLPSQALISLTTLAVITITSLLSLLPLLKMHGSYSDLERIVIMSVWAANGFLIIYASASRVRFLKGLNEKLTFENDRYGNQEYIPAFFSSRAIRHRRVIGYLWLIPAIIALVFITYSGVNTIVLMNDAEKISPLLAGLLLSLLLLGSGFSLLQSFNWSRWLCLPTSVLLTLSIFPVGQILGGYYLWYYFAIERQSHQKIATE